MNVISLFDGMSGGQLALKRANINYNKYFASEIDKYAIKVTQANFPNTIQMGSVTKVKYEDDYLITPNGNFECKNVNLFMGGSPCQGLSFGKNDRQNLKDPRSALFYDYVRLLESTNPDYFLLENVRMDEKSKNEFTRLMGVEPIEINSSLVSAQSRKRLYWTNIPVKGQPKDKELYLRDVIDTELDKRPVKETPRNLRHEKDLDEKSLACTASMYKGAGNNGMTLVRRKDDVLTTLTPEEVEKLQTVPVGYTDHVSNTQRYKMLGNGWTIDVIAYILSFIK